MRREGDNDKDNSDAKLAMMIINDDDYIACHALGTTSICFHQRMCLKGN